MRYVITIYLEKLFNNDGEEDLNPTEEEIITSDELLSFSTPEEAEKRYDELRKQITGKEE